MLRRSGPERLQAYCGTCQRLWIRHTIAAVLRLAKLPADHLDPADLVDVGLMLAEYLEPPVGMSLAMPRQRGNRAH